MATYIVSRRSTPTPCGYTCEPCSPFELSSVVASATILNGATAQALSDFFSHMGLEGWGLENLPYRDGDENLPFPGIQPGDVVYFIFRQNNTFQFWKGVKQA